MRLRPRVLNYSLNLVDELGKMTPCLQAIFKTYVRCHVQSPSSSMSGSHYQEMCHLSPRVNRVEGPGTTRLMF